MRDALTNISPLDGRYGAKVDDLRPYFSEMALMRYRVLVEVEWFIFLFQQARLEGTRPLEPVEISSLRSLYEKFDVISANRVKEIEKTTNHDVKAIEYFLKENLKNTSLEPFFEFIHFACTSEDINNLAYALMLRDSVQKVVMPILTGITELLYHAALEYKNQPMMSRTHGQAATPTTVGKEFLNILVRLERQMLTLQNLKIFGKMNGAVGNFNAHAAAYPKENWLNLSKKFIQDLGLEPNLYTTQIEPHDFLAEHFDALRRINTILIDFNRDMWGYISLGYFKQKLREGEVGSSTMPHKVNPIDFENSEGNLGVANTFLGHLAEKLPVSRFQRDLTDSTVLRNIGSALAYSVLAYKNCIHGVNKLELNVEALDEDLDRAWELLAEPIQTVMRRYKVENAYEQLKTLTRGKKVTAKTVENFIEKLEIPDEAKKRLKELTPSKYSGLAVDLVDSYRPYYQQLCTPEIQVPPR